jgi:hypothetical protein
MQNTGQILYYFVSIMQVMFSEIPETDVYFTLDFYNILKFNSVNRTELWF